MDSENSNENGVSTNFPNNELKPLEVEHKSNSKKRLIMAVASVFVLVGAGAGAYFLWSGGRSDGAVVNSSEPIKTEGATESSEDENLARNKIKEFIEYRSTVQSDAFDKYIDSDSLASINSEISESIAPLEGSLFIDSLYIDAEELYADVFYSYDVLKTYENREYEEKVVEYAKLVKVDDEWQIVALDINVKISSDGKDFVVNSVASDGNGKTLASVTPVEVFGDPDWYYEYPESGIIDSEEYIKEFLLVSKDGSLSGDWNTDYGIKRYEPLGVGYKGWQHIYFEGRPSAGRAFIKEVFGDAGYYAVATYYYDLDNAFVDLLIKVESFSQLGTEYVKGQEPDETINDRALSQRLKQACSALGEDGDNYEVGSYEISVGQTGKTTIVDMCVGYGDYTQAGDSPYPLVYQIVGDSEVVQTTVTRGQWSDYSQNAIEYSLEGLSAGENKVQIRGQEIDLK